MATSMKKAVTAGNKGIYALVDFQGGGQLMYWLKDALRNNDYYMLEGVIEREVSSYLDNGGKGKLVPIGQLVKNRNQERNDTVGGLRKKKGKGKMGPNILEDINQEVMQGDMMKALKFLDGGGKGGKGGSKYREICWKQDKRGDLGESVLHLCLLGGTYLHNLLSKKLILMYPKLVNDIFLSEDYYGQTPLHQAIVNEDPDMVRFLLLHGANVNERCVGAFFCPEDQKATRSDSLEHEWVLVSQNTNFKGRLYWGEYPLSFAACLNQEDCFRLLRAKKADPNARDSNGNTVMHLMHMMDVAYRLGTKLTITNNQEMTPLVLSAKLAKKNMFEHILTLERDVLWRYGNVICAAYPLKSIDTIEERTGEINKMSVLGLVVYGETDEHLDLLDGLLEDLIQQKWDAYGRRNFMYNFVRFLFYYLFFFWAFFLRIQHTDWVVGKDELNSTDSTTSATMELLNATTNDSVTKSKGGDNAPFFTYFLRDPNCFLIYNTKENENIVIIRLLMESLTVAGTISYVFTALKEARRLGYQQYLKTLILFPEKLVFHLSFISVLLIVPFRFACLYEIEHIIGIVTMLTTSFHFFFFCRGIKFIGPFVLMVFKILTGDLLKFFLIYSIFIIGFTQSFVIIFRDMDMKKLDQSGQTKINMNNPLEAISRLFIMSIGEFTQFYRQLNFCHLAQLGKVLFFTFELLVSIMLINLLIATMARTYQQIVETQKEWKRQWAKVILMLEQTMTPENRLMALLKYSRPTGVDKTKRSFVVRTKLDSREDAEMKALKRQEQRRVFAEQVKLNEDKQNIGSSATPAPVGGKVEDKLSRAPSRAASIFSTVKDQVMRRTSATSASSRKMLF